MSNIDNRRDLHSFPTRRSSDLPGPREGPAARVGRDRAGGIRAGLGAGGSRSEEHTSELQSRGHLVCRLLLEKKKKKVFASALVALRRCMLLRASARTLVFRLKV